MTQLLVSNDAGVRRDVLDELRWDSRLKGLAPGVRVEDSLVILTGVADSLAQKLAAAEAAHRVRGVRDVVNDIDVVTPRDITDVDIAEAARHALDWDVLVPGDRIRATIDDGWVTLEGTVSTWAERQEAERAVRYLKGVRVLINKIKVAFEEADSAALRDAIEEALARQVEQEANRVHVSVTNGVVTLSGCVSSWQAKHALLSAAGHAAGVRDVVDRLGVAS